MQALSRFQRLDAGDLVPTATRVGAAITAPLGPAQIIVCVLPEDLTWKRSLAGQAVAAETGLSTLVRSAPL